MFLFEVVAQEIVEPDEEDLFGLKSIQKAHVENHSRYQEENFPSEQTEINQEVASGVEDEMHGKRKKEISENFPLVSKKEKLTHQDETISFIPATEIQRAISKTPAISFPLIPAYQDEDEDEEEDGGKKNPSSSSTQLFEKSIQNVLEKEKAKENEKKETKGRSNE